MTKFEQIQETELNECRQLLEHVLGKLDNLGAGIAAIHVNAALEQIRTNRESLASQAVGEREFEDELEIGFFSGPTPHALVH